MQVFLLSWILFWTVTSFNSEQGAMWIIAACASTLLLWLKFRSTISECLTIFSVMGLSLGILLCVDAIMILIASCFFRFVLVRIGIPNNSAKRALFDETVQRR